MKNRNNFETAWYENEVHETAQHLKNEARTHVPLLMGTALDDVTGTGFAFYGSFIQMVVSEITSITLPGINNISNPNWTYVDAVAAIFQGGKQLLYEDSHRPYATKTKGVLNLSRGIGLTVVAGVSTTLGAAAGAALASQGIAGALGVAFILSCDDVVVDARRLKDPEYWFLDSVKKWDKMNKTISVLEKEVLDLQHSIWKNNKVAKWTLDHKKKRLTLLQHAIAELEQDIQARVKVNTTCQKTYETLLRKPFDVELSGKIENLISKTPISMDDKVAVDREKHALTKCKKDLKKSIEIAILTGITFSGMLLLCLPGGQIAGGILLSLSVAMLVKKYGTALREHMPNLKKQRGAKSIELLPLSPVNPNK